MTYRIGDTVFTPEGRAAIVEGRNKQNGSFLLDTDKGQIKDVHRHGIINGLSPEDRQVFNEILDTVRGMEEPAQRVEQLQKKIEEVGDGPTGRVLQRYLIAEMAHVSYDNNIRPRRYSLEEYKAE